jgi:glycosyltransferase involved in cell wall biosynthesis
VTDARRLLMYINLDFPPMTWAGVWRALGFVKYLPEHGYDVRVLCGDLSPGWTRYDPSLLEQIPTMHVSVTRLRGPFLGDFHRILDRRIERVPPGWRRRLFTWMKDRLECHYPEAHLIWVVRTLVRAVSDVRARRPVAVVTSGPPHLTHLVGVCLQRLFHLVWIADFRDAWVDDPAQAGKGWYRRTFFRWLERRVLASADAVTTVTPWIRTELDAKRRVAGGRSAVVLIANGHDIETAPRFPALPREPGPLRLFFAGTIQAGNRCYNLLQALCLVGRQLSRDEMPRVSFPGLDSEFHWHIQALGLGEYVHDIGVLSHARCLEVARSADVLLVLVKDIGPVSRGVLPAKVYEALALRRRILAVTPPMSDLRDLLSDNPLATCCADDADEIASAMLVLNEARRRDRLYDESAPNEVWKRHSRRERAQELASLIDGLL